MLVAEDDIAFNKRLPTSELQAPSFNWDVLLLSYTQGEMQKECHTPPNPDNISFCKVTGAATQGLYAVKKQYASVLAQSYNSTIHGLKKNLNPDIWAADQMWKHLQKRDRWFAAVPMVAYQKPGESDIEGIRMDKLPEMRRWLDHN